MAEEKVNLIGMTESQLRDFVVSLGEKPFRGTQLLKWIHQKGIDSFDEITDISKAFRAKLKEVATLEMPKLVREEKSVDGTIKWALDVGDGNLVETVYIPEKNRGTLCISSQVGCALDCSFCATGKQGFNRNLTAAEIVGQMRFAYLALGIPAVSQERKITNVVFMGMGEPLLNVTHTFPTAEILMNDNAYGLSKRRVTFSTSGIIPAIYKLKEASDASLAISLHAPDNELRNELVPVNQQYPLEELIPALVDFSQDYHHRSITIEYVMIDGVNDKPKHARALINLLNPIPVKMNLIPFNPFPGTAYRQSTWAAMEKFQDILTRGGIRTTLRRTRGDDINAACGQLAGQVKDRTQRKLKYTQVKHYTPIELVH